MGAGFACGGLAQDFELADLPYAENLTRLEAALPNVVAALTGRAKEPLANDPAIAACRAHPLAMISAAQSPGAVRRAARLGLGVLYDSLQAAQRTRQLTDAYREASGRATCIAIRRVWIGPPPQSSVDAQMRFYHGYAREKTQQHWGEGQELIGGRDGREVAENLFAFARRSGCDSLNLRVHLTGVSPDAVREQISRLGSETLPRWRELFSASGTWRVAEAPLPLRRLGGRFTSL